MIISVHPDNPQGRKLDHLIKILEGGGILIFPTDSVYAIGCDMKNQKAVDQVCRLRVLNPVKANLTFLCESISQISSFTAPIPNEHFRMLKRNTPGPITFILNSNQTVPKLFKNKKRTIGARIPDHRFLNELISKLGRPLMSATLKMADEEFYQNDLDEIAAIWENKVDAIVASGNVSNIETAIVDLTSKEAVILRSGSREINF